MDVITGTPDRDATNIPPVTPANESGIGLYDEQCKFERKAKRNGRKLEMIQCSVCAVWFHTDCVDLKKATPVGVWPCLTCRLIPAQIRDIAAALTSLDGLIATVRTIGEQLTTAERARHDDRQAASAENAALRCEIVTLKEQVATLTWRTFRQPSQPSSLLIGSSLIRHVSRDKMVDTEVMCIPGGKLAGIEKN